MIQLFVIVRCRLLPVTCMRQLSISTIERRQVDIPDGPALQDFIGAGKHLMNHFRFTTSMELK